MKKLIRFIVKYLLRREEFNSTIGPIIQSGSIFVTVPAEEIWIKESLKTKIISIVTLKWNYTHSIVEEQMQEISLRDIFGYDIDFGPELYNLMIVHNSYEWNFDFLSESDRSKSKALQAFSGLTKQLLKTGPVSNISNCKMWYTVPFLCQLTYPMIIKIPVVTLRYYLEIHADYAFNSIRKANHPQADSLIDYLYEILYIQQKTAIALQEFFRLTVYTENNKKQALMIAAEALSVMHADLIFTYLKASIEKIVVMLGLVFDNDKLDSKKTHKAKLESLYRSIPDRVKELEYFQFIKDFISSDLLSSLNNYRLGILHKRGISDLQPHNYIGIEPQLLPLYKIYQVMQEQHMRNTSILLASLAILTDELVRIDPISEDLFSFLDESFRAGLSGKSRPKT